MKISFIEKFYLYLRKCSQLVVFLSNFYNNSLISVLKHNTSFLLQLFVMRDGVFIV